MVPGHGRREMKIKAHVWIITCILASAMASCATVISGTQQRIEIVTEPPGSSVFVNYEFRDSTPCVIKVRRTWDEVPKIEITKSGYRDETLQFDKKMNEISLLNFINIFGWAADIATAACVRYQQPDTIVLTPRKKTH
jgi:hypothetical protein